MEKLLELLNEKEGDTFVSIKWDEDHFKDDYFKNYERKIISKRYGFIKWLVENDKIDTDKLREESNNIKLSLSSNFRKNKNGGLKNYFECKLLMLLAISDTPIEDLIKYLK